MKPWLTKSRFMAGQQCLKRLWQQCHDRLEEPASSAALETGITVGQLAHRLFPEGVLIEASPLELQAAIRKTEQAMKDKAPAIFEATVSASRLLARLDILERLPRAAWGIREVKSSTKVKEEHLDDLAFQLLVARRAGYTIRSAQLIHVNKDYTLKGKALDVDAYFTRVELLKQVEERLPDIEAQLRAFLETIDSVAIPKTQPWNHCYSPYECEFLERCTAKHPADWVLNLPRLSKKASSELQARGILSIAKIPDDIPLSQNQALIQRAHKTRRPFISPQLAAALKNMGPPAHYLDFEAMLPAVPIYQQTRPYQAVPFQWSLHHVGTRGKLSHKAFLASGSEDPRKDFVSSLLDALGGSDTPILVYSSYERTTLTSLAQQFPKFQKPLNRVIDRLEDLMKVVQQHYYHPAFNGSYSIKAVGPALAPEIRYDELEHVGDGGTAASVFEAIAASRIDNPEQVRTYRSALLEYCRLDTLAMVEVHRALSSLSRKVY